MCEPYVVGLVWDGLFERPWVVLAGVIISKSSCSHQGETCGAVKTQNEYSLRVR